jgi:AcrR family transcriptional regulator
MLPSNQIDEGYARTKLEKTKPMAGSALTRLSSKKTIQTSRNSLSSRTRAKRNAVASGSTVKIRRRDAVATRKRILEAAKEEFAARGLPDARIEDVALRAGTNRRLIYYYFGSKEGLYLEALEAVYAELMDEERKIDVDNMDPVEAIRQLVSLKINHYANYPRFIAFLNMENLYKARHLKKSKRIGEFKTPLTKIIGRVLDRGQRAGLFRKGIDPVDLYISISSLGYLYFSNRYTLNVIFGRDIKTPKALQARKLTVADMVLSYLKAVPTK